MQEEGSVCSREPWEERGEAKLGRYDKTRVFMMARVDFFLFRWFLLEQGKRRRLSGRWKYEMTNSPQMVRDFKTRLLLEGFKGLAGTKSYISTSALSVFPFLQQKVRTFSWLAASFGQRQNWFPMQVSQMLRLWNAQVHQASREFDIIERLMPWWYMANRGRTYRTRRNSKKKNKVWDLGGKSISCDIKSCLLGKRSDPVRTDFDWTSRIGNWSFPARRELSVEAENESPAAETWVYFRLSHT